MSQQAAEKYLKAFLIYLDIQFKRQHSLNYLLGLISQKVEITMEMYDSLTILEDYAVEIRYPDTTIDLNDEEIEQAIQIAKKIREYVLIQMNMRIDYEDIKRI